MFSDPADRNTFHGARMHKGNIQCNKVISCSFDPGTMNCISCKIPHPVLSKNTPVAICFADQNFVLDLSSDSGTGCIAVVR
jgi:hypothetical protein